MPINNIGQTTLSAAAAQSDRFITVASATGITAGDLVAGTPASMVYIVDPGQKVGEVATVISVSGTTIGLRRVTFVVPHVSGATVYFGPPDNFYEYNPRGSAVYATVPVSRWINTLTGDVFVPSPNSLSWVNSTGGILTNTSTAVTAKAATATLVAADFGQTVTNTGAGGAIVLTLPAAAAVAGQYLRVQLTVAQTVTLTPVTGEKIYLGGSGVNSKYLLIAGVIGNSVTLLSDGSSYFVVQQVGVATKEA